MDALRHIFVGGHNHWKVTEFQGRLLDWIIEALIQPSPNQPHLLLERIQTIGFRAVELLLATPKNWKRYIQRYPGWFRGRLLNWLYRPSYETIQKLVQNRDPKLFEYLNFAEFSNYVCDRFLVDRANIGHRYAMRMLLLYLFPDKPETGVGIRERVLHWFRNEGDHEYFARRLGATENLTENYRRFEAVKLLTHLFSPHVSEQLSTPEHPCHSRVFLLTFDQAEGRNELFEQQEDWNKFFAELSELYNTLPNVVILFTMTLGLRNELHNKMERQFRDRIIMDENTVLHLPSEEQIKELYVQRMRSWLASDPQLLQLYESQNDPYIPLTESLIIEKTARYSIRNALKILDEEFHKAIDIPIEPALDYWYKRNKHAMLQQQANNEYDYTSDHLQTLIGLFNGSKDELCVRSGIQLTEMNQTTINGTPVLRLRFKQPTSGDFLTIHLARLGHTYTNKVPEVVTSCLYNADKARNHLWFIRNKPMANFEELIPAPYKKQSFEDVCPPEVHTTFQALFELSNSRDDYRGDSQQAALNEVLHKEIETTYLDRLLRHVAKQLTGRISPTGQITMFSEEGQ